MHGHQLHASQNSMDADADGVTAETEIIDAHAYEDAYDDEHGDEHR